MLKLKRILSEVPTAKFKPKRRHRKYITTPFLT